MNRPRVCTEGHRSHSGEAGVTEKTDRGSDLPGAGQPSVLGCPMGQTKGHGTSLPHQKHGVAGRRHQEAANHLWTSPGRQ